MSALDLDTYRADSERFIAELSREYYDHFAGLKDDFEIEAIYERHAPLFERGAVDELRTLADGASGDDESRRLRLLLEFAVDGHMGQATKAIEAETARREAELTLEVDGERVGFRESSVVQANEPDGERRAQIESARLELTEEALNPLAAEALEQVHALARDLGWGSYRDMCEQLRRIDLAALDRQTQAFTDATDSVYADIVEPQLERTVGLGLGELRRSDLPWFFRFVEADKHFPAERLVETFVLTLRGLGIDLSAQDNVTLDVVKRPKKSPRAFCAPVRVPAEVYLVVPPVGGRDDYTALFHEGGHTEHFASVDPDLAFEFRHFGDNSVTEAFAFLFDHLVENSEWLRRRLDVEDHEAIAAHSRAARLVYLRRYAAKLGYELELHANGRPLDGMAEIYSRRLSDAVKVEWPRTTFLTDVDPGFYAASYLRAWALETHLRATLIEKYGPAWFEEREAGDFLRGLWRQGQRLDAAELLAELNGAELDFSAMLADLGL